MHKPANDPIFTFLEKKRSEGKCGKLAMVAGLNKFLRVYYGKVTEVYRSLPAIELAEISNTLFEAAERSDLPPLFCYILFLPANFFLMGT